jgi:hypothetical protein
MILHFLAKIKAPFLAKKTQKKRKKNLVGWFFHVVVLNYLQCSSKTYFCKKIKT